MSRIRSRAAIALIVAAGWACGDGGTNPPTPQPTSIQLNKTTVSLDALSATDQLSATVLDQMDQPMSGQPLTWASSAQGIATVNGSGLVTANSNGQATVTATSGSLTANVAVTVAQVLTQLARVSGDAQVGGVGQALAQPIAVEAQDRLAQAAQGSAAAGSVAFAVTTGGGMVASASVALDANGRASTNWTLGTMAGAQTVSASAAGGTLTTSFSATANAGPPSAANKASGDAQNGTVATPLGASIVVHVEDQFANPVAGENVDFVVTMGGGSVAATQLSGSGANIQSGASGPAVIVATDANGDATATWTLGNAPGANEVTYTVTGVPPGTFTATGQLGPPDMVIVTAGDGQNATVNTAVATPPSVQVVDVGGNPLVGETVDFTVTAGGGGVTAASPTTDGGGNATVGSWTLGTMAGPNELTATAGSATAMIAATGLPGLPANLAINDGDGQAAIAGTNVTTPPSVVVTDAFGNGIAGETVDFAVTGGGGMVAGTPATTDTLGIGAVTSWTLGATPAVNTLEASSGALTPVTFTANGVAAFPDMVVANAGDNQVGLIGAPVNVAPSVLVTSGGFPIAGETVTFTVTGGGGSVMNNVVLTDTAGIAQVGEWSLGASPATNTLDATVTGMGITGNPVTFTATGQASQFNIEVRFLFSPTGTQQAAFDSAEARWERMIIGDIPNVAVNLGANACVASQPAVNETVDDLIIFALIDSIDGSGGILGQAGPCVLPRATPHPAIGTMFFDEADMATIEGNGQLPLVILHEMGHVVGYGTLWPDSVGPFETFNLLRDGGTSDPYFVGPQGLAIFDSIGGTNYTGGNKVPVANTGGAGTRDGHWRESVFGNELMTGFINGNNDPLSVLSIASVGDMNYVVNYSEADPYSQMFSLRAFPTGPVLWLKDDIWTGPLYVRDRSGRLIRVR